jgi:predicted DNA binding CopG/RHH family protein
LKIEPPLASIFSEADMPVKNSAPLSDEEKDLIESTERGEWRSVGNIAERRAFWQKAAQGVLDGRRQRISISVPERDLARLKARAAEEGMPIKR